MSSVLEHRVREPGPAVRQSDGLPFVVGFVVLYIAAAVLGRLSRVDGTPLALVWPAATVGYLWLTWSAGRSGLRRDVPVLALAAGAANLATGTGLALAAAFAVANAAQALVAVLVVRRVAGDWRLRTSGHVAALVGGSAAGAVAGAFVGTAAMSVLMSVDIPMTFATWVVRNASNTFVFAAVVVRVADLGWRSFASGRRAAEWTGTGTALVALHLLVFAEPEPLPIAFFVMPASVWVALRFSTTAAAAHVLLAGLFAVGATAAGLGPFQAQSVVLRVVLAQAFVATVGLVTLVLAMHRDERDRLMFELAAERDAHAAQNALLEGVLDSVAVAVVACDADGRLTLFNRAAREFHGTDADPTVDPEQWAATFDLFDSDGTTPLPPERIPLVVALREERIVEQVIVIAPHDLPARTVRVDGRRMLDPDGRVLGAVVAQTDITRLQASEREFRDAFEYGPTPSARLAADGTIEQANPALRRLLSRRSHALVGRPFDVLVADPDRAPLDALLRGEAPGPIEIQMLRAAGAPLWCEVSATAVTAAFDAATAGDGPGLRGLLVQILDVHERRDREQRLEAAAQRDPLTGLANRAVANARLASLSGQSRDRRTVLAYLDLDGFKQINDVHGHDAGDAVLVAVAARLRSVVRTGDDAVRLGGDEFLLIVPVDPTAAHAEPAGGDAFADRVAVALAGRVEDLLSEPVEHAGLRLTVGASVGTVVTDGGEDPADLLTRADQAMYERKRARKAGPGAAPTHGPDAERWRLQTLLGLDVLDTAPDPALDEIVRVAAVAAGVPTALVSLVDEHRQWFKARCGLGAPETGRDVSFCAHVVHDDGELHVHDATADPRFADNALVTGAPHIKSYAGFPLRALGGHVLGSLCVIGYRPGSLDDTQRQVLRHLAAQVAARLASEPGRATHDGDAMPSPRPAAHDPHRPDPRVDAPTWG